MKLPLTIFILFFYVSANSQIDISGDWKGRLFYPPLTKDFDSLSITLILKVEGTKITGNSVCLYPSGAFTKKSLSGKFYKKKDGFYVQEDNLDKKNFGGPTPLVFLDRYDFDFANGTTDELNGTTDCLRSVYVPMLCHSRLPIKLTRINKSVINKSGSDTTTVNH